VDPVSDTTSGDVIKAAVDEACEAESDSLDETVDGFGGSIAHLGVVPSGNLDPPPPEVATERPDLGPSPILPARTALAKVMSSKPTADS
jgi:hypothetical protein